MRMVLAGIVAISMTMFFIFTWYISQPIIISATNIAEPITQTGGWDTVGSAQMYTLIRLGANAGFGLCIIFIWIWFFVSAQAEDWRSEEGYA